MSETAGMYLVARLFTDAVFNGDIRAIQLIIQRIDGGLPKDTEIENYRTDFGDCLIEILQLTEAERVKVKPDDTVLMALAKSLFDVATRDIYWNYEKQKPIRSPRADIKNERDTALKIITDRVGGRRGLTPIQKKVENIESADWLASLETPKEDLKSQVNNAKVEESTTP